jgi:hypothetical protein
MRPSAVKKRAVIAILVLPCFLFPASSEGALTILNPPNPVAVKGVLDLTKWDFKRDGPFDSTVNGNSAGAG